MNMEIKKQLRSELFRHLDGIVTAPVAVALYEAGVLQYIISKGSTRLEQLTDKFDANEGYLNVALYTIACQGWLDYGLLEENKIIYRSNNKTQIALDYIPKYAGAVDLINKSGKYHRRKFDIEPFRMLEDVVEKYKQQYINAEYKNNLQKEIHLQVLKHIEGIIVGPTVVLLGMSGMFHKYFMEASFRPEEFHTDGNSFSRLLDIFVYLEWFRKKGETYSFTDKGLFYAKRASAYGVTVSYIPTFRNIQELLFGDPKILWHRKQGIEEELHVDRAMNVWGSGGAHSSYFKVIDDVILNIFNQDIEKQPKGIIDIGCGNGALLIHLYELIEKHTLRGKMLEEHPLFLIGADFNRAALHITRNNIVQSNIWAKIVWGDIGQPYMLGEQLKENYGISLDQLLNVRTFLDHNRVWNNPSKLSADMPTTRGAFAFRGQRLSANEVESSLLEHMGKWYPYLQKFGLLVIELHTISPELCANNLGKTAACAYSATHGFSDQYIVEIDTFMSIADKAGLVSDLNHFAKFPNSEIATISIHYMKAKNAHSLI